MSQGFDFHTTIARRPVFFVDYWPGVPGVTHEGRPDVSWDLEHFKAYADPIAVRSVAVHLSGKEYPPQSPLTTPSAWFIVPDLLSSPLLSGEVRARRSRLVRVRARGRSHCGGVRV